MSHVSALCQIVSVTIHHSDWLLANRLAHELEADYDIGHKSEEWGNKKQLSIKLSSAKHDFKLRFVPLYIMSGFLKKYSTIFNQKY